MQLRRSLEHAARFKIACTRCFFFWGVQILNAPLWRVQLDACVCTRRSQWQHHRSVMFKCWAEREILLGC